MLKVHVYLSAQHTLCPPVTQYKKACLCCCLITWRASQTWQDTVAHTKSSWPVSVILDLRAVPNNGCQCQTVTHDSLARHLVQFSLLTVAPVRSEAADIISSFHFMADQSRCFRTFVKIIISTIQFQHSHVVVLAIHLLVSHSVWKPECVQIQICNWNLRRKTSFFRPLFLSDTARTYICPTLPTFPYFCLSLCSLLLAVRFCDITVITII